MTMPWWGWVTIGTMLLAAELFVVEADFYLVFLGVAALAVGLLDLVGLGGPLWREFLLFAVLAVGFTALFRGRLYAKLRPDTPPVSDAVVGESASVRDAIAPGGHGHAELRGAVWQAKNVGDAALAAGARARVAGIDGLTLLVRSEN
jgi:membrane protein implicated in regulation of membrane protease activity